MSFLSQFVDSNKIGGWVRAGVAALIGSAIAKWPLLANYLDPTVQQAIGVAAAGVVVGVWSTLTKTDEAKVKAAAAIVDPETGKKTVVITTPALAAATPETNIVSNQEISIVSKETP